MSFFWGDLLKDLRAKHHVSLSRLSQVSGVRRHTIRNIEDGAAERTGIEIFERLLKPFGYDIDAMRVSDPDARLQRTQAIPKSRRIKAAGM